MALSISMSLKLRAALASAQENFWFLATGSISLSGIWVDEKAW